MSYNQEAGMYEGYIYCIENLINNKKYIGYTKNDIKICSIYSWITYIAINPHLNMKGGRIHAENVLYSRRFVQIL